MKSSSKYLPLITFTGILIVSTVLGRMGSIFILENHTDDYTVHSIFDILSNLVLAGISYVFIKRYGLIELAGLSKGKKLIYRAVLFFPLYLVIVNLLFADAIFFSNMIRDIMVLAVLCISISLSEEYALRGFLQSYLIKNFASTKRQVIYAVIGAALIFGVLHLIKYDKGLYGELSQVAFATFIGVMFGAILVRTKRMWPLIILHALIDFAAKIDGIGEPFSIVLSKPTTLISAVVIALIVLPCFILGWVILRKRSYRELVE